MLNMLDGQGRIVQCGGIPDELLGLDRFEARKRVVDLLDAEGALVKVEDRTIATPYGDRSGVVIEPWLTDQWYVDAATLVKPVVEATRSGEIKIVPETWAKTWFNWLDNIQPWCVSRQLWWGHRVPAWFDDTGNIFVAETVEEAQSQAGGGCFAPSGRRRSRHLVLLRAVAVCDAWLAGTDDGSRAPLPQ
jgi:valyl-tRNA synthetase